MNPCTCPKCKNSLPQIKSKRGPISPAKGVQTKRLMTRKRNFDPDARRKMEETTTGNVVLPVLNETGTDKKGWKEVPYFKTYNSACKYYGITPIKYIDNAIKKQNTFIDLHHIHLKASEFKSLFVTLAYNVGIVKLNLQDTNLKDGDTTEFLKICLLKNDNITELNLSNNNLGNEKSASHIGEIIRDSKSILKLNLESTKLRDCHALHLRLGLVQSNITEINMSHNSFSEFGGIMFADQIKHNTNLKRLDISWNNIRPKQAALISKSLENNTTLIELNIAYSGVDDTAFEILGKSLERNYILRKLNIAGNRISNDGVAGFSPGLSLNKTLEFLDISYNPITASGIQLILVAIIKNASLVDLRMKGISPDSICMKGIGYLKRERLDFKIEHSTTCTPEFLPRIPERQEVKENVFQEMRDYLIKERLRVRDLFNIWDKKKSGELEYNDVVTGLNEAGIPVTVDVAERLFRKLDTKRNGKLSPNEFCAIVHLHSIESM